MAINTAQLRQQFRHAHQVAKNKAQMPSYACIMIVTSLLIILMAKGCNSPAWAGNVVDMAIIAQIESSNNSKAYNKGSGAIGLCQITPVVLLEYNNMVGMEVGHSFSPDELYDPKINMQIANWYMNIRIPQMLEAYGIDDDWKTRLWAYNAGIGNVRHKVLPSETYDYLIKYDKALNPGKYPEEVKK